MNERLKELRNLLGLNQREFSAKINIGQSTLAMLETGQRALKDIHISQICSVFNVNEEWLRYGQGEIFIEPETFSLDEYAKKRNLTALELDIIKGYLELDSDIRQHLISHFKSIFDRHSEIAATKEDYIDREVENYRRELEAEQKGETSLVLGARKENLG